VTCFSDRDVFAGLAKQISIPLAIVSAFLVQPTHAASDVAPFMTERYSKAFDQCAERVGGVTSEMHQCYGDEFERIESALEAAYLRVLAKYPERARNEFRRSEWRWNQQMEKACNNDPAVDDVAGGSIVPFVIMSCIISKIKARTRKLTMRHLHQ